MWKYQRNIEFFDERLYALFVSFLYFIILSIWYTQMMSIDNNTRQFYLSMGYSESQIAKAIEQSQRLGIDVLDALNLPP